MIIFIMTYYLFVISLLPIPYYRQERTAHWTHGACSSARLLFLFSHGVLVLSVSTALENLDEAAVALGNSNESLSENSKGPRRDQYKGNIIDL